MFQLYVPGFVPSAVRSCEDAGAVIEAWVWVRFPMTQEALLYTRSVYFPTQEPFPPSSVGAVQARFGVSVLKLTASVAVGARGPALSYPMPVT